MTRPIPETTRESDYWRTPFSRDPKPEHCSVPHIGWKSWCPLCVELREWVYEHCNMELPGWTKSEMSGLGIRDHFEHDLMVVCGFENPYSFMYVLCHTCQTLIILTPHSLEAKVVRDRVQRGKIAKAVWYGEPSEDETEKASKPPTQ